MKLLCINTPKIIEPNCNANPIVVVGQTYTYNDEEDYSYELKEHMGWCYHKKLFIPLSEIDETEMIREYKTQLA